MKTVKYRGITGTIRRGIANGTFKGEITPSSVREHLLPGKSDAPDKVITASLQRLANRQEIVGTCGRFYTKGATQPSAKSAAIVSIVGKIRETKMEDGKLIAVVEVSALDQTT